MRPVNLIDKAFLLKRTRLFGALDLDLLLSIADKMEHIYFQPEERVFQYEQEAFRMYLIISGQVEVIDQEGSHLAFLRSGEFFGDEAMFNEKQRSYTALCKTKVELLSLSRSHLISIINECPSVALSLLEAYSSKIIFRPR